MSPFDSPCDLILLAFTLGLVICECSSTSTVAVGSRRFLLGDGSDLPDAAIELNATNFDAVLKNDHPRFAVVEFFAHWCPACRNYKPHYEKVARLFNGPDAVHAGVIVMARVDCAFKTNKDLCDRFSVNRFPQLLWGPSTKFASGSWDPNKAQDDIKLIDDIRPADHLLNWINKQFGSSFSLDDERHENPHPFNTSNATEIAQAIYDVEETTAMAFDIISQHKMITSETQTHLIKFLHLIVAHHPSKRCRRGSAQLLLNSDELWPSSLFSFNTMGTIITRDNDALKSFRICGNEVPRGSWRFCQGSNNETRGFSCGLWVLLHSLSVRVGDGESHWAFTTICDFVHNFFLCEECRQHFYEMCSSVSSPFNTTRDLTLWLWSTHNKVNERLKQEEKNSGTADPKYPKMTWPSQQLCPSCYISLKQRSNGTVEIDWNTDEVLNFLARYYGKTLVSSYEDTAPREKEITQTLVDDAPNSVAVPVGAALAVAFASCLFAAFAWFWRMHQKNRKPKKRAGA